MGFLKNLAKNGIKNGVIKGICFSLPYRLDIPCEIAAGSMVDVFSEKGKSKDREMIVKTERSQRYRSNVCVRKYPKGQDDPIDAMIRNSARRPANKFRNHYPQSRIDRINKIEVDLKKRI